mmetsp:Transcript_11616/g.17446  ORF Transcript_11616/g.17446 Transcript_11616/m.17446 type:complete len:400 (-) Transcript_11616:71-1270(-)
MHCWVHYTERMQQHIQKSAYDSLCGKFLAHQHGYLKSIDPTSNIENDDNYLSLLFQSQIESRHLSTHQISSVSSKSSSPIMNKGYYARHRCYRELLRKFLDLTIDNKDRQVVILGSGFDSLALNLVGVSTSQNIRTYEIDFPEMIKRKVDAISNFIVPSCHELQNAIKSAVQVADKMENFYRFSFMNFFCADISVRNDVDRLLSDLVRLGGFDRSAPTLILSECVLVYMDSVASSYLSQSLLSFLQNRDEKANPVCIWASYDMVNPYDRFGETMLMNIRRRGLPIPGFTQYPTLSSQENRFLSIKDIIPPTNRYRWVCKSRTMLDIYNRNLEGVGVISAQERLRVEKLEMLDEVEEWNLLMSHYSMTVLVVSHDEEDDNDGANTAMHSQVDMLMHHMLP